MGTTSNDRAVSNGGVTSIVPGRSAMMAMLLVAYTLNFIDRQIIGILAEPIKEDLGLSDSQLGWMGGAAFALFYTSLAIPIARLADRRDRSWIVAIGLALWSLMTAVCGLAANFWQLFLARMGVGIGEAAGVAPAYSLISDLYPPQQRARALAFYSLGIPIGNSAGVVFGGVMAAQVDWRWAFFTIGLAGVLFAPLFKMVVKDPGHGYLQSGRQAAAPSLATVLGILARKPAFWLLSFGAGTSSLVAYGFAFWLPSLLARSYGLELVDRSLLFGAVLLVGGMIGIMLGGILGDRLGSSHPRGYALVPGAAFVLILPVYLIGFSLDNLWLATPLFVLGNALALVWLGPVVTAITNLVASEMRATASAAFLFINNLVGLGLGTAVIGMISDALSARYGEESLRYSAMLVACLYALAALLMLLAARRLQRDWYKGTP